MKTQICLLFFFSVIYLSSCEGPKGDPGPIGIPSPPPAQAKQGFIRGELSTIIGKNTEKFKFDFQGKNYGDENYYEVINDTITNISIGKIYAKDGEPYINGKCLLAFTVKSLKYLANPVGNSLQINFRKELKTGELLDVGVYGSIPKMALPISDEITVSELTYDSTKRIINGKFSAKINQNDAAGNKLYQHVITNGSFNSELFRQFRNAKRIE